MAQEKDSRHVVTQKSLHFIMVAMRRQRNAGDCLRPGSAEFRESLLEFAVGQEGSAVNESGGLGSLLDGDCRTTTAC